jgi:sporulation protein YqfC
MERRRSRRSKLQRLAGMLEIPPDVVLDWPRITMLGNKQLLVENHKGIIEYTGAFVRIKLTQGELAVTGSDLVIGSLQAEQLLVEGTVTDIKYDA